MLVVIGMDGVKKKEVHVGRRGRVSALACAGDAVVVGLCDGRLQLRKAARLDHVSWSSQVHKNWIIEVCVLASGTEIATACDDGTLAVVSFVTGQTLRFFEGHTDSLESAHFISDRSNVITTSLDETVRVWHLYPGEQQKIKAILAGIITGSVTTSYEIFCQLVGGLRRIMFKF